MAAWNQIVAAAGDVYNDELANKLGNLYSRVIRLVAVNYNGVLTGTAGQTPDDFSPAMILPTGAA